jgi:hypothetical protein
MLPQIARGDANKLWIIPSEIGDALKGLGGVIGKAMPELERSSTWSSVEVPDEAEFEAATLQDPGEALAEARRDVAGATAEAEGAASLGAHHDVAPTPAGQDTSPTPPPPVPPLG